MKAETRPWRCGCGFESAALLAGAPCVCGLNPYRTGTLRRVDREGRGWWRFVQDHEPLAVVPLQVFWDGMSEEALSAKAGDVGSVCGRWTSQLLTTARPGEAALSYAGRDYRFVRRSDEDLLPWLGRLMQGCVLHCVDPAGRGWMLLDAMAFRDAAHPSPEPPLEFVLGRCAGAVPT
jgi:hypothetical protein